MFKPEKTTNVLMVKLHFFKFPIITLGIDKPVNKTKLSTNKNLTLTHL